MKYLFNVQEKKKVRVILDTDAACEADDQYAIVHALLTPKFIVKGIIAEQFSITGGENSVDESYAEIVKLQNYMGSNARNVPVVHGLRKPLESEKDAPGSGRGGIDHIGSAKRG